MKAKTITTVLAMSDRGKTQVQCDASVESATNDSVADEASLRPKVLLSLPDKLRRR